jgi:hypothetical protein
MLLIKQNGKCMHSVTRQHVHSVTVTTAHNFKEKNENANFPCQRCSAIS